MTEIGLIPYDWELKKLSDICLKITDGSHFSPAATKTGYYMASVKDMRRYGFDYSQCKVISEADFNLLVAQGCQPIAGDVLIAKDGATLLEQVFVQKSTEEITILSSIAILRPNPNELCSHFLNQYLSWDSVKEKVRKQYTSGSALPRIILKNFRLIPIPLPPLPEQQKIADILTTVDDHISETEALIEKAKVLKQGLMQQLLTKGIGHTEFKDTEIGRIPVEWEVKKVGDVGSIRKGKGISRDSVTDFGLPCIRYGEIYTDYDIKVSCTKSYISEEIAHNSEIIHFGDLLFTGSGETAEDIGKSVTYLINEAGYAGGDLIILSPDFKIVEPLFLSYQWEIKSIRTQRRKAGQGASIIHLYSDALKKILISLPPLPEQRQIAAILTSVDDQIETYQAKLASLTRLKTGLMQQLLTGKIRVTV